MNHQSRTTEFDHNLIEGARKRSSNRFLESIENPSLAISHDVKLIQRARDRSYNSQQNKKELNNEKMRCTATDGKNWLNAQAVKSDRIIRDLQYELTAGSIDALKKVRSNALHRESQIEGIATFEMSLIKRGLGGGDDEGTHIGVSYEREEAFLHRIADQARESFPSDAETSNFVTRLKARTKEKKSARHEKDRRRRKTASNQQSSIIGSVEMPAESDTSNDYNSSDDEVTCDVSAMQNSLTAAKEESVRIFAEQSRMRHGENNHKSSLIRVIGAQQLRANDKHRAAHESCRDVVLSLLDRIAYDDNSDDCGPRGYQIIESSSFFSVELMKFMERELSTSPCKVRSFISCIGDLNSHDCWMPFMVLSANIGRWSCDINYCSERSSNENVIEKRGNSSRMKKIPLFLESSQSILEELLEISCADAITDKSSSSNVTSLACTQNELHSLRDHPGGVILILGGGPGVDICCEDVQRVVEWAGGVQYFEQWDVAVAIEIGRAITSLFEVKNPTVSFVAVLEIYLSSSVHTLESSQPLNLAHPENDSLKSLTLSPKALKAAADIAEATTRIMGPGTTHAPPVSGGKADVKSKVAVTAASFTDTTFGILLGQALWLRNYLKSKYIESFEMCASVDEEVTVPDSPTRSNVPCPFSSVVVARRCNRVDASQAESDRVTFALAFDWFLTGGTKESLLDMTADNAGRRVLRDAMIAESEAAAGGKKGKEKSTSKSKGATIEVEVPCQNMVRCIVRMSGRSNVQTPSPASDPKSPQTDNEKDGTSSNSLAAARMAVLTFTSVGNHVAKSPVEDNDEESLELILVETAATGKISYVKLNFSDAARCASVLPIDPLSMDCSVGVCTSEILLSIALALVSPSTDASGEGSEHTFSSTVAEVVTARRKKMSHGEHMWLLHILRTNCFNLPSACRTLNLIMESELFDHQMVGAVLMSYGLSQSVLDDKVCSARTHMADNLKSKDVRFVNICLATRDRLSLAMKKPRVDRNGTSRRAPESHATKAEDINVILEDCVCLLGDVIDDRHICWIALAKAQEAALERDLLAYVDFVSEVSGLFATALLAVHKKKIQSSLAVGSLMVFANYATLPWTLLHSGSKATRRAVDVRRGMLRAAAALLESSCAAIRQNIGNRTVESQQDSASCEPFSSRESDPWREIVNLDNRSFRSDLCGEEFPSPSLVDAIADELGAELMERAVCILTALNTGVEAAARMPRESASLAQITILKRYEKEHSSLIKWTAALHESMEVTGLSRNHEFDVEDEADSDETAENFAQNGLGAVEKLLGILISSSHSITAPREEDVEQSQLCTAPPAMLEDSSTSISSDRFRMFCKAMALIPRRDGGPTDTVCGHQYSLLLECSHGVLPGVTTSMFRPTFSLSSVTSPEEFSSVEFADHEVEESLPDVLEGEQLLTSTEISELEAEVMTNNIDLRPSIQVVKIFTRGHSSRKLNFALEIFDTFMGCDND